MRSIATLFLAVTAVACAGNNGGGPADTDPVLLTPNAAAFQQQAPDTFVARFQTTTGSFDVEVIRDWAPNGADRFYNLVRNGYYDGNRFFRVLDGFMAQVGLHGDPAVNEAWTNATIPDDPVTQSNRRGMVSFATRGENSRTTQIFINYGDNSNLDAMGFSPFGRVAEGMEYVDALYGGYGEGQEAGGTGPSQQLTKARGNAYLQEMFPRLDYIQSATIVER